VGWSQIVRITQHRQAIMKNQSEQNRHRLSRRQWLAIILTVAALALWIGINAAGRLRVALQPPPPEAAVPLAVELLRLEPRNFEHWLRYAASMEAEQETVLQSRVTAHIREMPLRSGALVRRGELLVKLDDEEFRQELARLRAGAKAIEAELALARKQLERQQQLFATAATSQEQVDEARTRTEALKASLEESHHAIRVAQTKVGYAQIDAPFDGIVGRLFALPGDLAAPGQPLIEVIDTRELKALFSVPQRDLSRISVGTEAEVRVPALDRVLSGRVDRLHPRLQSPGRGAEAETFLPQQTDGLFPGMEAVVRLLAFRRDEVLVVPVEALHRRPDGAYVFIFEENVARRRTVTPSHEFEGRIVIEEGLAAGDMLILTPHPGLADGRSVAAGAVP
jgi:membrane fusion protein, multidrug efflux system